MNKTGYIGIIIAIAVGIALFATFANLEASTNEENFVPQESNENAEVPIEPENKSGKHYSVELTESMTVSSNP